VAIKGHFQRKFYAITFETLGFQEALSKALDRGKNFQLDRLRQFQGASDTGILLGSQTLHGVLASKQATGKTKLVFTLPFITQKLRAFYPALKRQPTTPRHLCLDLQRAKIGCPRFHMQAIES